jgi:hypothetical protein
MTPDQLITIIRTAGLIKVHDGQNWIDLRPVLVDFIETAILVRAELDHQVQEVEELNQRIQKVANGTW